MSITYGLEDRIGGSGGGSGGGAPGPDGNSAAWARVSSGIGTYYNGLKVMLWTVAGAVGLGLLAMVAQSLMLVQIFSVAAVVAVLIAQVMFLIGLSRMTAAPQSTKAAGLLQVAFIGSVLGLLSGIGVAVMQFTVSSMSELENLQIMQLVRTVISLGAFICLLVGLGRLSVALGRPDLKGTSTKLILMIVGLLVFMVGPALAPRAFMSISGVLTIILLVLGLAFLIMLMGLLSALRDATSVHNDLDVDAF